MPPREAVVAVLREAGEPLHWTRVQDLALRRGYLDPFDTPDLRRHVLRALAQAVADGEIVKIGKGVYGVRARGGRGNA